MLVFISWSGERGRAVAQILQRWLGQVIQAADPWISVDVAKGARWGPEIAARLEESRVGIICLTKDNLDSRWVLFEAGALSKTKDAHVCTFLLDIGPSDVEPPLGQFQHTTFDRQDVFRLVETVNAAVSRSGGRALSESALLDIFNTFWPQLDQQLHGIDVAAPSAAHPRPPNDILAEVLAGIRSLERRFAGFEERQIIARKTEFQDRVPRRERWSKDLVRSIIELPPDDAAEALAYAANLRERGQGTSSDTSGSTTSTSRAVGRVALATTCAKCKQDFPSTGSVGQCPHCGFKQYD
jgi:hypothetical protein